MNLTVTYAPVFVILYILLAGYGVLVGYQRPELWIRRLSVIFAPLLTALLAKSLLVPPSPTWGDWFPVFAELWGLAFASFLMGARAGLWLEQTYFYETLEDFTVSNKIRRRI